MTLKLATLAVICHTDLYGDAYRLLYFRHSLGTVTLNRNPCNSTSCPCGASSRLVTPSQRLQFGNAVAPVVGNDCEPGGTRVERDERSCETPGVAVLTGCQILK